MKTNFYKKEFLKAIYIVHTAEKVMGSIKLLKRYVNDAAVAVAVSGKDSLTSLVLTTMASSNENSVAVINNYFVDRKLPSYVVEELIEIVKRYAKHVIVFDEPWDVHSNLFDLIARRFGYHTIITGIRRGENGFHLPVERYRWGITVNPILNWRLSDVWAFIQEHNIPVPSVYYKAVVPWTRLQDLAFT